jgi:hypothetical protein
VTPLWPTYISEEGEEFRQNIRGLKPGAMGNNLGEHIVNLGNILGT